MILKGKIVTNHEGDYNTAFGVIHLKKGQPLPGVQITMDDPEVHGERFWGTFSAMTDRKGRYRVIIDPEKPEQKEATK